MTAVEAPLLIPVALSGFILALIAPALPRIFGRAVGWVVALLPLAITVYLLGSLDVIAAGDVLAARWEWVPSLDAAFSLRVDGLALIMVLLVAGIGALIMIYARGYLGDDPYLGRFYALILIFMAAMLTLVMADNVLLLFTAWELTSISSYLLIGFKHEAAQSQKSALQALLVTGSGGLALLAGLVLLALAGGSWELTELLQAGDQVRASTLYLPALLLVVAGAFTKSAQFPFHFWLPNAMAAPTPVSAYLHSATMVKAGVYLLARLNPVLGGTEIWFVLLTGVGAVTALLGGWLSWQQVDLKKILAYSTVSALGTLVMLIGLGGEVATKALIVFLVAHSLYKGALFMAAGAVDHEAGTRDVRRLAGLWRMMPFTALAVTAATLSMAGLPPLLGFISKELLYEGTLAIGSTGWRVAVTTAAVITNVTLVGAAGIMLLRPFFGRPIAAAARPHHRPVPSLWVGPVLLGALALAAGLFSTLPLVTEQLVAPAVAAVAGVPVKVKLGLWHGFTPYLQLSILTVALGAVLYALHGRLRGPLRAATEAVSVRVGPEAVYNRLLAALYDVAGGFATRFQNGNLNNYLTYVLFTLLLLVGGTLLLRAESLWPTEVLSLEIVEIVIGGVIVVAALAITQFRSRLAVIASLGVVGYGMALLYILYGAPDLAMTQFAIETLTVVLFVLILYRLPVFETLTSRSKRVRDALLSAVVGVVMTLLVLMALSFQAETPLSDYFIANSYVLAQGRNIVNVILVDFRGLDTMMEIVVLGAAAGGVYALLRGRLQKEDEE